MEWLNPAGWWAWLGIPIVIGLYLLRRKATRHEVPSLLLWQRMEYAREAQRPFQRLRKQWLLVLQLLLVAILAFALMRPAGMGGLHGEMILIFDVSASMQAQTNGQTRLSEAVNDALALVDGMQDGDTVTIFTAGQTVGQPLSRSTDRQAIKSVLTGLRAENGTADMDGALSLALAVKRDAPGLSVIAYSDALEATGQDVQVRTVGHGEDNRSVLSLRLSDQGEGMAAFARLVNFGEACEVTLECYADGALCDIRTVSISKDGQQNVQMQVPGKPRLAWVEIKTKDALMADNVGYWVRQEDALRKALLVTEGNVFLEKALSLRGDITLYKTDAGDAIQLEGYDLYVFDGPLPEALPDTGSVLALLPDKEMGSIGLGEEKQSAGTLRAATGGMGEKLTENLMLSEITLRAYKPVLGGESILTWGGDALLAVEEQRGRRMAVLGFDLHDSNLPMKADFPILMQNLLDYLLPNTVTTVDSTACGQPLALALGERTEAAKVVTPSGKEITVEDGQFTETNEIGVYTLLEKRLGGEERITTFALHMPSSESDIRRVAASEADNALERAQQGTGREWTVFFLATFMALLLVEWEVSRRGA